MRVLGIDPGIERMGFAVLETAESGTRLCDAGRIVTSKGLPLSERLRILAADLRALITEWKPEAAGIEQLFFSKNVKTAMTVSSARGVILEVIQEYGIPIHEFNPSHIKLAVTGDARADKTQIKKMIRTLLSADFKRDDAADAIACAICLMETKNFHASL